MTLFKIAYYPKFLTISLFKSLLLLQLILGYTIILWVKSDLWKINFTPASYMLLEVPLAFLILWFID